jgi:GTP cyclohydrolase I
MMVYRILENKIEINEENKEVKKGLVITKSLETHVCCEAYKIPILGQWPSPQSQHSVY